MVGVLFFCTFLATLIAFLLPTAPLPFTLLTTFGPWIIVPAWCLVIVVGTGAVTGGNEASLVSGNFTELPSFGAAESLSSVTEDFLGVVEVELEISELVDEEREHGSFEEVEERVELVGDSMLLLGDVTAGGGILASFGTDVSWLVFKTDVFLLTTGAEFSLINQTSV